MNKGMSELEQRFYFTLGEQGKRFFGINDIEAILHISPNHARNLASDLAKKGISERVKRGLYVRVPESVILKKSPFKEDMILIASHLCEEYFLSHYSALQLHNLTDRYSNTVYLSSPKHQRNLTFYDNYYRFVKITKESWFGIGTMDYYNRKIKVSDLERTIIDVVDRPMLSGGWTEVIECLKNLESIDEKKLLHYIKRYNNKKTARIIGYLISHLLEDTISNNFKKQIKKISGNYNYYIDKEEKGSYVKEWNLIIPNAITKGLNAR